MSPYHASTTVADVLPDHTARALIEKYLPGIFAEPELVLSPFTTLGDLPRFLRGAGESAPEIGPLWEELAQLPEQAAGQRLPPPAAPAPRATRADGPADLVSSTAGEQWGTTELAWQGRSAGNPFVDVELEVTWRSGTHT